MLMPVIPEPMIAIDTFDGRFGDWWFANLWGSICQDDTVGFGTGRPGSRRALLARELHKDVTSSLSAGWLESLILSLC